MIVLINLKTERAENQSVSPYPTDINVPEKLVEEPGSSIEKVVPADIFYW